MDDINTRVDRIIGKSVKLISISNAPVYVERKILTFICSIIFLYIYILVFYSGSQYFIIISLIVYTTIVMYVSTFAHEAGHFVVRLLQGCKIEYMVISSYISCVSSNADDVLDRQGIAIGSLAGPLTNIILCSISVLLLDVYTFGADITLLLRIVILVNMCFIITTVLPIRGSDGWRVLDYTKHVFIGN